MPYIYLLTYLLAYSMVQSPSWEANWFAASQEIPRISRNPNVHYRIHKRQLPVSILGQPNPVHIPTSHLLDNRPNIIHPSTPRSHQWSLSLWFPQQEIIPPPLTSPIRARPMPHTNIKCGTEVSFSVPHFYAVGKYVSNTSMNSSV